jgi:hypothetical protein
MSCRRRFAIGSVGLENEPTRRIRPSNRRLRLSLRIPLYASGTTAIAWTFFVGLSLDSTPYFGGFAFFLISTSVDSRPRSGSSSSFASARIALVIASVVMCSIPGVNFLISVAF